MTAKFKAADIDVIDLFAPEELKSWYQQYSRTARNSLFLVDYEFRGCSETGLDTIKLLDISTRSILVTGRFDESEIRKGVIRVGVRLIPKSASPFVPLILQDPGENQMKEIEKPKSTPSRFFPKSEKVNDLRDSHVGAKARNCIAG